MNRTREQIIKEYPGVDIRAGAFIREDTKHMKTGMASCE